MAVALVDTSVLFAAASARNVVISSNDINYPSVKNMYYIGGYVVKTNQRDRIISALTSMSRTASFNMRPYSTTNYARVH